MYRAYFLDLDGTVYRGSEPIPFAAEVLAELRLRGAAIRFLTNNSAARPDATAAKLNAMGISAIPSEVISSASATVRILRELGHQAVFVVGEPSFVFTLREAGITVVNAEASGEVLANNVHADAVVVGICRSLSYQLLDAAMQSVLSGAQFIATNLDATFPLEGGRISPGSGTMVAALELCTGVQPVVAGKPEPYLVEMLLQDLNLTASAACVVGDRIDTDIECGIRAGCATHLVLTGVTHLAPPGLFWSEDLRGLLF